MTRIEETPVLYRLKGCEVDAARLELRRDGQTVPVEPQVLELLLYLVANRDRAVTRAELFERLWRGRVVGDSALNSRIKAARAAIGDDGASQAQIRTLHRTGYRFVGPVEELAPPVVLAPATDDTAATAPRSAADPEPMATAPAQSVAGVPLVRRWLGFAGAALGLLIAAGAYSLLPDAMRRGGQSDAAAPATPAVSQPANARKSLAVLPFTNLSPDAEAYFADAVSVELLNILSRLPDLQVTGRTSAAYFKGRRNTVLEIGETLGVGHLLTGSVLKGADRVRIMVELVDAKSGYVLWSDRYEHDLDDIFAVQDEIAARVATALQVKLGLGESAEIGMTRNVAAYDEFLRGVALYSEYRAESFPRAVEHMRRAIALDPTFSRAWAYLYCIHRDGSVTAPQEAEEWLRLAVEALAAARELTPDAPFVRVLDARNDIGSKRARCSIRCRKGSGPAIATSLATCSAGDS